MYVRIPTVVGFVYIHLVEISSRGGGVVVVVEEGKVRGQALLGANSVRLDTFPRGGGGGMPPSALPPPPKCTPFIGCASHSCFKVLFYSAHTYIHKNIRKIFLCTL